jgi:hypothetical protein
MSLLSERESLVQEFLCTYIKDPITHLHRPGIQRKVYSDGSIYEGGLDEGMRHGVISLKFSDSLSSFLIR